MRIATGEIEDSLSPEHARRGGVIEPVEISFVVAARPADVRTRITQHLTTQGGRIKLMYDDALSLKKLVPQRA